MTTCTIVRYDGNSKNAFQVTAAYCRHLYTAVKDGKQKRNSCIAQPKKSTLEGC
jgi:hypothetical protein